MSYSDPDIQARGTVSGEVTTSGTDENIVMQNGALENVNVIGLSIKCITDLELKINDEANYHKFLADDKFTFHGVSISKIVIKGAASVINFKGLYY